MKKLIMLLWTVLSAVCAAAQPDPSFCPCFSDSLRTHSLRVCFYNVENFFDCLDDSLTKDDDFTSEGAYHWTSWRYYRKADQIAKVLLAAGGWDAPDVIGLAEVENESVLKTLVYYTVLKTKGYRYVHFDSPDSRGIDVALLYRPDRFRVFHAEAIPVVFPSQPGTHTRDILYVNGMAVGARDTLHLFVNHFTSRYGGYMATVWKRNHIASLLRSHMDSILRVRPDVAVLAMGDFNDTPTDSSMQHYLKASLDPSHTDSTQLLNLMYPFLQKNGVGTHKFQRQWSVLDQFIVNPRMLETEAAYRISAPVCIFAPPFILTEDAKYLGKKPFRTFLGRSYQGGFSDHLPILLDLAF